MKSIQPKKDTNKVAGTLPPIPKGHRPHQSGSGKHSSAPKRLRTRSAQRREALKD